MPFSVGRAAEKLALFGLSTGVAIFLTTATMPPGPILADGAARAAAEAPPPFWSADALRDLHAELNAAAGEGLDPADYGPETLAATALSGDRARTDDAATAAALRLARDYAFGRVDPARFDWHIERYGPDSETLAYGLEAAVRANRVRDWLRGLLPSDARYAGLRAAYADAEAPATRDRLRANLERWRWMPREIGSDYVLVNVPAYRLQLFEDGAPVATHDVIVGKPSTPTPQIAVPALSLVVNPWWSVPPSIARRLGRSASGFDYSGGVFRQPPGPRNALGKIKLDMPNPQLIYLHDTPAKGLFAASTRTFSNGCIRVKNMDALAADLLELDRSSPTRLRRAMAGWATRTVAFERFRPVYLVYFTAEADADGRLTLHADPYGRDARLIASLDKPRTA
jgi:murein L,D-transpeptidase YcbB/YkuD